MTPYQAVKSKTNNIKLTALEVVRVCPFMFKSAWNVHMKTNWFNHMGQ